MYYPKFTIDTKAINMASIYGYSPYSDIVWSFDYAISGNDTTEAGFTVFLMDNVQYSGGSHNIDLGYSGLSASDALTAGLSSGIKDSVVAIGFDTTGMFAASATMTREISATNIFEDAYTRDGIGLTDVIPNSISMRGGWPDYSFYTHNYNVAISSLDSSFKIVESNIKFKTIRARLGNVGQTIYIDYRGSPDDDFKPLFEKNINLNITSATLYKVGISFATPIVSNDTQAVGTIHIRNFHTEGAFTSGATVEYISEVSSDTIPISKLVAALPPEEPPIPKIQAIVSDVTDSNSIDSLCSVTTTAVYGRLSSVCLSGSLVEDAFNFGYQFFFNDVQSRVLTRNGLFSYRSDDGSYLVYKDGVCNYWTLSTSLLFMRNSALVPIGTYTNAITGTYIAPLTAKYL